MGTTFYFGWEVALMEGLQAGINSIGVVLASALTMLGEEATLVAILGFLYWCYDKKFGKFIGTNIVVGITLNPMLKNMVYRRRPYMDHEGIQCLKQVKPELDHEAMCNPKMQARFLAENGAELFIACGLCVGHDALFNKSCPGPVTALVVRATTLIVRTALVVLLVLVVLLAVGLRALAVEHVLIDLDGAVPRLDELLVLCGVVGRQ